MTWNVYLRLARFDKPVGIVLLWVPTAWALWIANSGHPSYKHILIFFLGTCVMRAAGCIVNDIADRQIDLHVKRTKARPLTTGEITVFEAFGALFFFLSLALVLLLQLPYACLPYAIAALFVTILYPFCKRFMKAPQLVLGVAFSMGIPMAYAASGVLFDAAFYSLFLINFLWIVAYDTQYAMVDREDDLRLGVKSTAIFFGSWDKAIINFLLAVIQLLWLILAINLQFNAWFFLAWFIGLLLFTAQYRLIAYRSPEECFQAFLLNAWYGMVMWGGVMIGLFLTA